MLDGLRSQTKTDTIFDSDKLHSELKILDWIFYQICVNKGH